MAPSESDNAGRRVDGRTLAEQVSERLREDILSGEQQPGATLSEAALAESFGVSRGPVREALRNLASEGLITIAPRRGAVVTELTQEEFIDAYQVREALETLAIQLAVPRLTEDDLRRLRDLHEEMVQHARAGEVHAFFDTNARFHELFVASSGNSKLLEYYRLLLGQMGRYLAHSLALRGSVDKSIAEHSAILEAVEARDARRAAKLLADHIEVPQRIEADTGETPGARPVVASGSELPQRTREGSDT